ncbi:ExbD/TolR family protein [Methylovulum psychrotolerans]|jgi:biopolymer transport protein ExbD|uniref:Biopolymer transporter ExbD n=1 Tax=Methylovulum psychrotolerans TaxID=1704499 RepID=A0A1Z4BZ37_9GAMM|nr:biopolymer transporter ExbD [Methylovulum psychrotolerans]ASF46519.1 biopolymer transporter ExbD [Methylovulum psychrotolerans]MBT9097607.1 biopolymer transporter ExbD [Methylovulum psychrotolerans]POZ53431.1 biopolymer transporter ExbD [Methylovulum psychrotolerans]
MKVQEENAAYDEINVTPMLDLAYVLLVVFILMCTASVQGITVDLPKASDAPSLAKPQTKAITVTADGTIFLDTYPVDMAQLESMLQQFKAVNPALPVVIKGDASVQYVKIVDVLALLGKLDITQIGLVTQNLVK